MSVQRRRRLPRWAWALLVLGLAGVGLPFLMTRGLFFPHAQEGIAMAPSVPDEARFFVSRLGSADRGDVVVVDGGGTARVIGVAGDTVAIAEGQVVVNGEPLGRRDRGPTLSGEERCFAETWRKLAWLAIDDPSAPARQEAIVVPEGHVYLLADHRPGARDSRAFGPIPASRIRGVLAWITHPGDVTGSPQCPRDPAHAGL